MTKLEELGVARIRELFQEVIQIVRDLGADAQEVAVGEVHKIAAESRAMRRTPVKKSRNGAKTGATNTTPVNPGKEAA